MNAIPIRDFDHAIESAKAADKRLLAGNPLPSLFGLPLGVKDLNDVAGLPTVKGSPRLVDHVASEDERVVAAMKQAGAIVVGKTNVPEMGFGATTDNPVFGITRNPFAPERSAAWESHPGESHPQVLAEPSVRFSPHSAPIRQTRRSCQVASARRGQRSFEPSFGGTGPRESCAY